MLSKMSFAYGWMPFSIASTFNQLRVCTLLKYMTFLNTILTNYSCVFINSFADWVDAGFGAVDEISSLPFRTADEIMSNIFFLSSTSSNSLKRASAGGRILMLVCFTPHIMNKLQKNVSPTAERQFTFSHGSWFPWGRFPIHIPRPPRLTEL